MTRISIHVCTRNRPTELCFLLQSLMNQTIQNWDLIIVDESDQPIEQNFFFHCLINKIKQENHYVNIIRNEDKFGVCYARQLAIDKDYFDNDFVCRLDDDVIIEEYYLQFLLDVIIEKKYDIASGVTPYIQSIPISRNVKFIKPIINKKEFDAKGNIIKYGDDCGCLYNIPIILPAHEFRSCALMRKEVIKKVKYEKNLSPVGFREEAFFSFRAITLGFKIGVNTSAIAWHLQSPQGGCRFPDYQQKVQSDDKYFKKWAKELYLKNKVFRNAVSAKSTNKI